MPHEVLTQKHLSSAYRGPDSEAESLAANLRNIAIGSPEYQRLKTFKKISARFTSLPANATDNIPKSTSVVRYNFQHDLESIWWLVLFYTNACVNHEKSQAYAEDLFRDSMIPTWQRIHCFERNYQFDGGELLHPNLAAPFGEFMENLRSAMVTEYAAREIFGQLEKFESYSYIHGFFAKQFRMLLGHNNNNWKDVPILRPGPDNSADTKDQAGGTAPGTKRGRTNSYIGGSIGNKKPKRSARK